MQVYALDIKDYIEKDTAWLAPNHRYYTSKEAYQKLKRKQVNARYYQKRKRLERMAEKSKRIAKKKLNEAENLAYKRCVQQMFDWLEYPTTAKMPKFFFGLLGQWHATNNYSYEIIFETMTFCEDMVQYALRTKSFESESGKVRYICAIIRDHLNDGMKQFARKQTALYNIQNDTNLPSQEDLINFGNGQANDDRSNLNDVMKELF